MSEDQRYCTVDNSTEMVAGMVSKKVDRTVAKEADRAVGRKAADRTAAVDMGAAEESVDMVLDRVVAADTRKTWVVMARSQSCGDCQRWNMEMERPSALS